MHKLIFVVMLMVTSLSLVIHEAEARRMGGGKSSGRQSQHVERAPTQKQVAIPAAPTQNVAAKPSGPWKGILGGALLGLGLGALFSSLGLSGAMGSIFSIILMAVLGVVVIGFLMKLLRKKPESPSLAVAGNTWATPATKTPEIGSDINVPIALQGAGDSAYSSQNQSWEVPVDFDTDGFLRNAKTYFLRLQAAWDKGDLNDLREFTTPEMFAELRLELQDRGTSPNSTDVMVLDAELMGVETLVNNYLASVRFSGRIRESNTVPSENFVEVWNLAKPISGSGGWLLAGIQQTA